MLLLVFEVVGRGEIAATATVVLAARANCHIRVFGYCWTQEQTVVHALAIYDHRVFFKEKRLVVKRLLIWNSNQEKQKKLTYQIARVVAAAALVVEIAQRGSGHVVAVVVRGRRGRVRRVIRRGRVEERNGRIGRYGRDRGELVLLYSTTIRCCTTTATQMLLLLQYSNRVVVWWRASGLLDAQTTHLLGVLVTYEHGLGRWLTAAVGVVGRVVRGNWSRRRVVLLTIVQVMKRTVHVVVVAAAAAAVRRLVEGRGRAEVMNHFGRVLLPLHVTMMMMMVMATLVIVEQASGRLMLMTFNKLNLPTARYLLLMMMMMMVITWTFVAVAVETNWMLIIMHLNGAGLGTRGWV
jgi:hypothetical protein